VANPMIKIDVVSDVICPWCFLGKRRLDKALSLIPDVEVEVVFRPFFLDPTIPPQGLDRHAYMLAKFGAERLATIHDPLIAAGKDIGVPYRFDKITRTPNTLNAHRLLRWAHAAGTQPTVTEALFMAYWHYGQDVSDPQVLRTLATINGLDGNDVVDRLATELDVEAVKAEAAQAQAVGVTGVPTYIIAQKYGVVGAQSPEVLANAIRQAAGASSGG
jgi:predicted DsbA family dithiol-disulfide isomerase